MILNDTIDDLLPVLSIEDLELVNNIRDKLEIRIESMMMMLYAHIQNTLDRYGTDRKLIGLSDIDDKSSIFSYINGKSVREIVVDQLKKLANKESTWKKL